MTRLNKIEEFGFHLPENYSPDSVERTPEGWWVSPNDVHHGRWVREHRDINHDPNFTKWCADWIIEGTVVVDIGANIGTHSVPYLRRNPKWLVAVEPCFTIFECLRRNILLAAARESFRTSVMAYCCGVSDDFGTVAFHYDEERPGTSFMTKDSEGAGLEVRPLGHLVEFLDGSHISLLKIDVEGYEPFVLKGAEKDVLNPERGIYRPVIVMEINNSCLSRNGWDAHKVFEYIASLNYQEMGKWPPEYGSLSKGELFAKPVFEACFKPR